MGDNPYERFEKGELILRDELAIDRTLLANERTMLAYMRGAITLPIAGVSFIHFIQAGFLRTLGFLLIPMGLLIGILGMVRYWRMDKQIRAIRKGLKSGSADSVGG